MTTRTTTKTRSQKDIEAAVVPANENIGTQEDWRTCAVPSKKLNAGECRWMREEGLLKLDGFNKATGATIYRLAVQS
jgi:hypothetical protein